MLHACFFYVPTCFMCTFIQYLAFSGTNQLTRCHSVSSCFLLFLCSENLYRKYSWNCTGQKPNTLFLRNEAGARRGAKGGPQGGQTTPRCGLPWACARGVSGPTMSPPTPPLRPYILHCEKSLGEQNEIHGKLRRRLHHRIHLGGFWRS